MSEKLSYWLKSRKYKRSQLTKLHTKIKASPNLSVTEANENLARVQQLDVELKQFNSDIGSVATDEELQTEFEECDSYDLKVIELVTMLRAGIPSGGNQSSNNNNNSIYNVPNTSNKLKLPEVPIPFYGHETNESLGQFLLTFENIVSKYPIGEYEKFILFKNHLRNEPLVLVKSLQPSQQSYEHAKKLLKDAFESESANKFDVIARLSKLKWKVGSSPYEFVGEMRTLEASFNNLSIDTATILQYFFWNAMPSDLQSQLIIMCNNDKPSLSQINDKIFKALNRCNEMNSFQVKKDNSSNVVVKSGKVSNNNTANNFAVNIPQNSSKQKRYFCTLCSSPSGAKVSTHGTADCPVYMNAETKIKRLRELNACIKCGYGNHSTDKCYFKFSKPCSLCKNNHMSFLCNQNKNLKSDKQKPKTSANTANIWSVHNINVGSNSLLPTFSALILGHKIRCMKDSGCQPNFIKTSVADRLNLPVIEENFPITINGFNGTQHYNTKVVRIRIEVGEREFELKAICVPNIRTSLSITDLSKCALGFVRKGYKLADQDLIKSDDVNDIEFILGTSNLEVMLETQVTFGGDETSVYSQTHAGILLFGNVALMLRNLNYLNDINIGDFFPISVSDAFSVSTVEVHPNVDISIVNKCDIQSNFVAADNHGKIIEKAVCDATEEMIKVLNYDPCMNENSNNDLDIKVTERILVNTERQTDGRLVMPLPWRTEALHLLESNFKLAENILYSNLKKLQKHNDRLVMIDDVFREQVRTGIIEKVDNLEEVKHSSEHSFLAHMPIFKLEKSSSKCRIVFLSNLSGTSQNGAALSHNQVMHAGPNLNNKITTAILNLRFGEHILTYDLKKAFNQIALNDCDANKLTFLWFNNVQAGDFSLVAYRNLRLSFGLRPSPTILMLALYKILCLDEETNVKLKSLKRLMYTLLYMDNGAVTGTAEEVKWAFDVLPSIFSPYKFELQQFMTDIPSIQESADQLSGEKTPSHVKLLGLQWDRVSDTISAPAIELCSDCKTKREILKSIASQYDVFNFHGPMLNRARLFLHSLQCDSSLGWDDKIDASRLSEWKNIVKQANAAESVQIPRFVGNRQDEYDLICFTDSSKSIYAAVIYIKNLKTGVVNFVTSKNRIVNKQMELKTIPVLELQALTLGVETLLDVKEELSGLKSISPIKICNLKLFSDNMIVLHWIQSFFHQFAKMQKLSVFVMNRLEYIQRQCRDNSFLFEYIQTDVNPADCLTRCLSYKLLQKSNYVDGPEIIRKDNNNNNSILQVSIPNPLVNPQVVMSSDLCSGAGRKENTDHSSSLLSIDKFSSFNRLNRVMTNVISFIENCKRKVKIKKGIAVECTESKYAEMATRYLISSEQKFYFTDVYNFCRNPSEVVKQMPELVGRMNIFLDNDDLLKVKCKFDRFRDNFKFPILLPKDSYITRLIIRDNHVENCHVGCYNLISRLRKTFWIEHVYTTVNKVLKDCVTCRRFNNRTVKLNQSSYRDFRANPSTIPFRNVFVDYLGPFQVYQNNNKTKVWILLFTCLWSRAVNLKITSDLTVGNFFRAFQMHVFEEGIPERIFSDLGSQITSAAKQIEGFLSEQEVSSYLSQNNIESVSFQHYSKGNSSLGSLVEVFVKFIKRLIQSSVRNNVLDYGDFELLMSKAKHLVNSRPLTFKDSLRDYKGSELP